MIGSSNVRGVHGVRSDEEWEAINECFETNEAVWYEHRDRVWVAVPDLVASSRRPAPSGRSHIVTCVDCGWDVRESAADPMLPLCARCVTARRRGAGARPPVPYLGARLLPRARLVIHRGRLDDTGAMTDRWALNLQCGDPRLPVTARDICETEAGGDHE